MHEWKKKLDSYGLLIEDKLSTFLLHEKKNAEYYHSFIGKLYNDLFEFILKGGKRLASCSTLITYKGFTNDVDERILFICVGMELYRHAILIHDDLVDNDDMRRGAPTLHNKYSSEQGTGFGERVAVFAGNILNTLALKAIMNAGFTQEKTIKTVNLINEAFKSVNESQILDIFFENTIPDVDEWYTMASKRAASLFKASLLIGAISADASDKDQNTLENAAEQIGYCFDIQDDIIDLYASSEQYGREPGGDLLKHKKPLHIVYTYLLGDQAQQGLIENIVSKHDSNRISRVKKIVSDCGALEAAKQRSRIHAESAKKMLLKTSMNDETKQFFTSFIDYIKESLSWYT